VRSAVPALFRMSVLEDTHSETTDSESCDTPDVQSVCAQPSEHESSYFFKMLIGRDLIGRLLGRDGAKIAKISEVSEARMQVSKLHDVFPGTMSRVLNIYGKQHSILRAIDETVHTLLVEEASNENTVQDDNDKVTQLGPILCLVPLGLAGSVIGKGGSNIKKIAEQSGCRLQFAGSFDPYNTYERTVSFYGPSAEAIVLAIRLVFECLVVHPIGISIRNRITVQLSSKTRCFSNTKPLLDCYFNAIGGYSAIPKHSGAVITPPLSRTVSPMPSPIASSEAMHGAEKCAAAGAMYGTFFPPAFSPMAGAMQTPVTMQSYPYMHSPPSDVPIPSSFISSAPSTPQALTMTKTSAQTCPMNPTPASLEYISKYISAPTVEPCETGGAKMVMTLGVDEHVIGCIIGKHGHVIQDLMNFTKTNITVSKRGKYQEGSTFRIVVACGFLEQLQVLNTLIINRLVDATYCRHNNSQQQLHQAFRCSEQEQQRQMHFDFCRYSEMQRMSQEQCATAPSST